jgi:hypothetical protein
MPEVLTERVSETKPKETAECLNRGNEWCLSACGCKDFKLPVVGKDSPLTAVREQYFEPPFTVEEDATHAAIKNRLCLNKRESGCTYTEGGDVGNCLNCPSYAQE